MPVSASVVPIAPIAAHSMLILLLQIGCLGLVALVLGRVAARVGMPPVVGELLAGVLLGPSLLGWAAPAFSGWLLPHQPEQTHMLDAVGQIGVLLLVGVTGTELDLGLVRRRGGTALRISLAGLLLPFGLGIGLALLLPSSLRAGGDTATFAMFLGVAMCVSAIPVISKTLMDMNLLHRNVGQLTLAAGTVDDIFGWFMLSIVSAMAMTGVTVHTVSTAVGYLLLIAAIAVLLGPRLVRLSLAVLERRGDSGSTLAVVCVMIVLCSAATQSMGMEAVFGAFVCGIVIGSSRAVAPARLAPLRTVVRSFLAPVFFATAGLRIDLTTLKNPTVLGAAAAILIVAVVGKFVGAYFGARASGLNRWEGLALGAGMNARGVIEIIVATVGLRLKVLDVATYTIVVLVAIITSMMAPPILRATMRRVELTAEEELRRRDRMGAEEGLEGAGPARAAGRVEPEYDAER